MLRDGKSVVLRGLGNCTFERANEALVLSRLGRATRPRSARRGGRRATADAGGRSLPETGRRTTATPACGFGPTARAQAYAAPIALDSGYCALSMLFSDWDRSGRAPVARDERPQYYTDSQVSSGGWRGAERAPVHGRGRLGSAPDLGHGHCQLRSPGRWISGRTVLTVSRATTNCRHWHRTSAATLSRYRAPARRDGGAAFHGDDTLPVHGLAPEVPGCEQ